MYVIFPRCTIRINYQKLQAGVKDKHSVSHLPILDALHWVLRIIELRCVSYNLKESRQTQLERYK